LFKVINKKELTPDVHLIELEAPDIAGKAQPGQFVVLRIDERGERIPLTIADFDRAKGTITILFLVVGKSTRYLSDLQVGDYLTDVSGPLGKPSEIEKVGTVLCAGGGVGIGAIHPVARAFREAGNRVIVVMGFRNKNLIVFEDRMRGVCDELHICTDDGSRGFKGFVAQLVDKILKESKVDLVYAIGPTMMMRTVCDVTRPYGVKTMVSLNPIMVDGTGMCGSCRVSVGGKTTFCCVDGPDFDGHQVDFDLLMARQRMYLEEEKLSMERYETQVKSSKKRKCQGS